MIRFNDVTFNYSSAERRALDHVHLEIKDGEFVLVSGDSGSGKSTLLRCLNGLVPHFYGGKFGGRVTVNGVGTTTAGVAELSTHVGLIFQDSGAQIVADTVEEEIAFGPLNLGLSALEVKARVANAMREMGLSDLTGRRTATLSGGEKQKVVIASVLSLEPSILALDEPLAELDPASAVELVNLLSDLNRRLGLTVIVAEHRLDLLLPAVGRVVGMEEGRLLHSPDVGAVLYGRHAESRSKDRLLHQTNHTENPVVLDVMDLSVSYGDRKVLNDAALLIRAGEIVALMGNNGSGKTTLFRTIAGFIRPDAGTILLDGIDTAGLKPAEILRRAGYVPQRPSALLFAETVGEELETKTAASDLLHDLDLDSHVDDYPRDLSLGEQQRVALAAVLAGRPALLLLDEPTHGLDHGAKVRLAGILRAQASGGAAIMLATHDADMAALVADRVLRLEDGRVTGGSTYE